MEDSVKLSIFRRPLFMETFGLLALVGLLNYLATVYHLYWSILEFDSIVHFLGGATLSTFFLWLYFFSGFFTPSKRDLRQFLLVAVVGSMFMAISWEIFELFLGEAAINKAAYPYDTLMDFLMDFLGMVGACFYGYLKEYGA